ncbi:hypothetical protein EV421DRAFT_619816 [Armillaria borealis]|uniref:Uncharacterized protein n=1 Tax=Armillaria borealis TaxID=47425 RepID=A0AA39M611_9AGAR|nr:hypothetical protein EV421DRAFT_619816 [Armillaria borealis]
MYRMISMLLDFEKVPDTVDRGLRSVAVEKFGCQDLVKHGSAVNYIDMLPDGLPLWTTKPEPSDSGNESIDDRSVDELADDRPSVAPQKRKAPRPSIVGNVQKRSKLGETLGSASLSAPAFASTQTRPISTHRHITQAASDLALFLRVNFQYFLCFLVAATPTHKPQHQAAVTSNPVLKSSRRSKQSFIQQHPKYKCRTLEGALHCLSVYCQLKLQDKIPE